MSALVCQRCGAENSEFNLRCSGCGAPLADGSTRGAVSAGPAEAGSLVGCHVARYRIEARLGRGGMGVVYRAEDERSGRSVALKTVLLSSSVLLPTLRREIHALSRLRHPGIVRILEHGVHEGLPWYAMEMVPGATLRCWAEGRSHEGPTEDPWWTRTLTHSGERRVLGDGQQPEQSTAPRAPEARSRLRTRGSPLQQALTLVRRLCSALAYLHGEGLVHRDLKPENVIVRRGLQPVLVDFGLAAGSDVPGREALDSRGSAHGTPLYMAPEQIQGETVDARADLYALGCMLYELVAGQPPFEASNEAALLEAHLFREPRPPSAFEPELPAELDALVLRLLEKEPRRRLGYAEDVAAALAALGAGNGARRKGPRPRSYLYRPGFAGREEPMRRLETHLVQAQGVVLVGGESGAGKTRLLLELARVAGQRGWRVLSGECVPAVASSGSGSARAARGRSRHSPSLAGGGGPLQGLRGPLVAVADRCLEQGLAETERLLGRRGKVLAAYEPALLGLPGQEAYPEPVELPADAARLRVFSYLADIFAAFTEEPRVASAKQSAKEADGGSLEPSRSRLAARGPLLLLLDDLQWADDLTVGFLEHWLRVLAAGGTTPLLVVGAYRSEEVGAQSDAPLQRLIQSPQVTSLDVGRLDEPAVASIVGDMLALAPPPALFVRHLARHSEGNPFFVAEYLRAAVAEELLWRDGGGLWQVQDRGEERATAATYDALPLPTTLRELVSKRLEGLGRHTRRLAEAAAVLGRESDLAVLGTMLSAKHAAPPGDAALLDALGELLRRQVLEVPSPGRLRFMHDKIREIAYGKLRRARRKSLHRAAADSITRACGPEPPSDRMAALGYHWDQGGDPEKARPCYLAAARHAVKQYDHAEAERLYRAYLGLVEEPTAESITARNELGVKVLRMRGRTEEAIAEHGRAADEGRRIGDVRNEAESLSSLATVCMHTGRMEQARQSFEQALAIARPIGDRHFEGIVLGGMASVHCAQGRLTEARRLNEQALAIHRELGNRHFEGMILNNLAHQYVARDQIGEERALREQALGLLRQAGDGRNEAIVLTNLADVSMAEERFDEAQRLLEQALALFGTLGDRRGEAVAMGKMGYLLAEQGRPDEARPFLERSLALMRQVGDQRNVGGTLETLALLERRATGNLEKVGALVAEGERLLEATGARAMLLRLLCGRGAIALVRGQSARGWLERAERVLTELGVGLDSWPGGYVVKLRRAVEAFEAGEHHRLFRGELIEDIPEGLRRWLRETGQL